MSTTDPNPKDVAVEKTTVTINIDGRDIEANKGELLIAAAERTGTYVPRFCYHPRMEPVGMCRMCLVNVEGPRGTSMQPSCMLTVSEGMKVDTKAPEVKKAQDGVLEFLLVNHPLDCPVCDKGGECPLQDQTLAFGPGETRFVEEKRHFEKPIDISPLVALDRERCVLCDRCTRFSKDVAGDPLIHFQGRGNQTQVNVFPSHPFSSYFSGNTVQICPVGALTAKPYRFKARPWDLEQVESTCTSCSVGCRVAVQSSGDKLTRYLGLDAEPTNHGWMCDKGRFDFEALNSDERLTTPMVRKRADGGIDKSVADELVPASWGEALQAAAAAIKASSPQRVGFIGGSRFPNEDQYAWSKFARAVVGTDNVDAQLGDGLPAEAVLGVPRATIDEACAADVVVLLAPDIKEELPVLYLRLREAVLSKGLQVIELAVAPTSFTPLAAQSLGYRPGEAAVVVNALLGKGGNAPTGEVGGVEVSAIEAAHKVLVSASNVVVIAGRQSVSESSQSVSEAIGLFAQHSNARLLPALRRSNVMGALDMGLAPGLLPGRVTLNDAKRWYTEAWGSVPARAGLDTTAMLQAAANGKMDVLVLLGADPLVDFPDRELAREALENVDTVIAVDILPNASVKAATIVLPAAAYSERQGTTTNIEGRVTRLGEKVTAPGVAWPDWMIATEFAQALGTELGVESLEEIWNEIHSLAPSHFGITPEILSAKEHRDGVVAPFGSMTVAPGPSASTIAMKAVVPPTVSYRVSEPTVPAAVDGYSVRLVLGRKLYDRGTLVQFSPSLADLVPSQQLRVHPSTLAPLGIESGGTVRLLNGKASMLFQVQADEEVTRGTSVLPFNVTGNDIAEFIDASQSVTNVRVETP